MRALAIILIVVAVILGGLLTLRSTGRAGLPREEVLKRAQRRADEQRRRGES